jgi:hypothetical protein
VLQGCAASARIHRKTSRAADEVDQGAGECHQCYAVIVCDVDYFGKRRRGVDAAQRHYYSFSEVERPTALIDPCRSLMGPLFKHLLTPHSMA